MIRILPATAFGMFRRLEQLGQHQIDRLRQIAGAAEVFDLLAAHEDVYLVGGAVRDLLIGAAQFDFDFVVEGDGPSVARELARQLKGEVSVYEKFGTATVSTEGWRFDIATARTETYDQPGAAPVVSLADIHADLARRDFSINAIAVCVSKDRFGEIVEFPGARADLEQKLLRVLHDQSFMDDGTRLLRMLRYGVRFGFRAEPFTEELARRAIASGAVAAASPTRIRDELFALLAERAAINAIEAISELGLDRALHPRFEGDEYAASQALIDPPVDVQQNILLFAACCAGFTEDELSQWMTTMSMPKAQRRAILETLRVTRAG